MRISSDFVIFDNQLLKYTLLKFLKKPTNFDNKNIKETFNDNYLMLLDFLNYNYKLQSLKITSHKKLDILKTDFESLIINCKNTLKKINFYFCDLNEKNIIELSNFLQTFCFIEKIELNGNENLLEESFAAINELINRKECVQVIESNENDIDITEDNLTAKNNIKHESLLTCQNTENDETEKPKYSEQVKIFQYKLSKRIKHVLIKNNVEDFIEYFDEISKIGQNLTKIDLINVYLEIASSSANKFSNHFMLEILFDRGI